ncbi:hypothetical protein PHMEG_000940 [Phytophthora megakarya]|uniref:Uncharacterized protein n=1 Tax=Phytophthora megakarya TaxID=4795 RepID=A0A225X2H0_9STRA|nr:hypothetical protein PHMEG_000940 [Phytophthora megakarya]
MANCSDSVLFVFVLSRHFYLPSDSYHKLLTTTPKYYIKNENSKYVRVKVHESFHRQQLRKVIGVRYPSTISNDKLHKRTKTEPLRSHLLRSRWRLFGHILRRPAEIPANRFMIAFFTPSETGKWRGRHRQTLPTILDADLQTLSAGHRLQRAPDLYLLRLCAQDRAAWKDLTESLLAYAPLNGPWSREKRNVENER